MTRGGAGRGTDRGSALLLLPAGLLVVVLLGSLAFDTSVVFLRQRQAAELAAGAANDAATAALRLDDLRDGGFTVDEVRARDVVAARIGASEHARLLAEPPSVVARGDTVEVTISFEARYVFAAALPGAPRGTIVRATASATAQR